LKDNFKFQITNVKYCNASHILRWKGENWRSRSPPGACGDDSSFFLRKGEIKAGEEEENWRSRSPPGA